MQTEPLSTGHPLADTIARFAWLIPVLPLVGFVLNGLLSLRAAGHPGPADPSAAGHGHDGHHRGTGGTGDGHAAGHDDGHHAARHPAAALVSLIGPGVLART